MEELAEVLGNMVGIKVAYRCYDTCKSLDRISFWSFPPPSVPCQHSTFSAYLPLCRYVKIFADKKKRLWRGEGGHGISSLGLTPGC